MPNYDHSPPFFRKKLVFGQDSFYTFLLN